MIHRNFTFSEHLKPKFQLRTFFLYAKVRQNTSIYLQCLLLTSEGYISQAQKSTYFSFCKTILNFFTNKPQICKPLVHRPEQMSSRGANSSVSSMAALLLPLPGPLASSAPSLCFASVLHQTTLTKKLYPMQTSEKHNLKNDIKTLNYLLLD